MPTTPGGNGFIRTCSFFNAVSLDQTGHDALKSSLSMLAAVKASVDLIAPCQDSVPCSPNPQPETKDIMTSNYVQNYDCACDQDIAKLL